MHIDTTLLRERFIINETAVTDEAKALDIEAPSTRMFIGLQAGGLPAEEFVIRTQNMHSCARMVSGITANYEKYGPLMPRKDQIDWDDLWDKSLSTYERLHNQRRWVCVYHKGKILYQNGSHHAFLDVIEKCAVLSPNNYNNAVSHAEDAFSQAGKDVSITYASNVALVAILNGEEHRCSTILRAADKSTTFNFNIKPAAKGKKVNIAQGLSSAADFLEATQLAYLIGVNQGRLKQRLTLRDSDEDIRAHHAQKRLAELEAVITSMEGRYKIRYRPERPNFETYINHSEKFAHRNVG